MDLTHIKRRYAIFELFFVRITDFFTFGAICKREVAMNLSYYVSTSLKHDSNQYLCSIRRNIDQNDMNLSHIRTRSTVKIEKKVFFQSFSKSILRSGKCRYASKIAIKPRFRIISTIIDAVSCRKNRFRLCEKPANIFR